MTSITATSAAATASTAGKVASPYNNLNETDFLKLLTTQLANQDPTNPVDNTQMLAQLAQFSTLSAQNQTNTNLTTISDQISKLTGVPIKVG
ncbi:flagellar hook capping FlgD N-terminal domain-containing protein [Novosphingobium sp.]|uniref:flagellar hook assembly protein FlgD n=1 Tax=Novosphingobium sp. TaxID=1874826 RepID=UPI00333F8040